MDGEKQDVLDTAVPHLVAEKMLQWQQAHFDALKAIFDKLEEIVQMMKEARDGVPGSTD